MKKHIISLSLLLALAVGVTQRAGAQTTDEYNAALATISTYHSYYISAEVDDVTYYLKADGTITTTKGEATALYFEKVSGNNTAYGYGFRVGDDYHFSNPSTTKSGGSGDIKNEGTIRAVNNTRVDWEAQVFFLNGEGKYAVRATNAPNGSWKPNTYWTIIDYNEAKAAGYADDAAYIWSLEDEGIVGESAQLAFAVSKISNSARYYITTYYNGSDFGSTKYYLTTNGTLSDSEANAGIFTTQATTTNQFVSVGKAFRLNFGNSNFTNGSSSANRIVPTTKNHRDDFEGQVFYYDGTHYAIRSTNHSLTSWNESAYWCVETDNEDDDELPQANYGLSDVKHFVWEMEQLPTFSHEVTHRIKCVNSGNYRYFRSPIYNTGSEGMKIYRTGNEDEAMQLLITPVSAYTFYLYDVLSGYYVKPGSDWTASLTPTAIPINFAADGIDLGSLEDDAYAIGTATGSYANANGGANGYNTVANWNLGSNANPDKGSYWYILPTENSTASTLLTGKTYNICFNAAGNYLVKAAGVGNDGTGEGNVLGRTNNAAEAGRFTLIPVIGNANHYYIYETTTGNFVTPATGTANDTKWTVSNTTPAPVLVSDQFSSSASCHTYKFDGDNGSHANAYNDKNGTYVAHWSSGSAWTLNRLWIEDAEMDLAPITSDVESLVASAAAAGVTLKYSTTVTTAAKYGSLVLPFDATIEDADIKAYQLSNTDGNAVYGYELDGITANEPVLLKNVGESDVNITFTATNSATAATTATPTSGLLTGTYESTTVPVGNYVLQKFGDDTEACYHQVAESKQPTAKPFRAYMTTPTLVKANVLSLILDGTETGIRAMENGKWKIENGKWYDLSGRRVAQPKKGLYIVGDKKVIIK